MQNRIARSGMGVFVCLCFILMIQLGYGSNTAQGAQYSDIDSNNPDQCYVNFLSQKGILKGYTDGSFKPQESLTRAQGAVVLAKAANLVLDPNAVNSFKDVKSNHWAQAYISAAVKAGYLSGYPDGTFKPDQTLNRAEGIALLLRLSKQPQNATLPQINDINSQHWAAKAVAVGLASGMVGLSADGKNYLPNIAFSRINMAHALGILLTEDPQLGASSLSGKLKPVQGKTTIIKAGSSSETELTTETTVNPGDSIITAKGGSAELSYPDGSSMLIKEESRIIIKDAQGRKYVKTDGQEGIAVDWLNLDMQQGTMFAALAARHESSASTDLNQEKKTSSMNKLNLASLNSREYIAAAAAGSNQEMPWYEASKTKKVKVKVDMPWGVAAVRGTFILINVVPGGQNSVSCLTGDVSVSNAGQTVDLGQNQSTAIGAATAPPAPSAPLTTVAAQQFAREKSWIEQTARMMDQMQATITPPPPIPLVTTIASNVVQANKLILSTLSIVNSALSAGAAASTPNTTTSNSSNSSSGGTTVTISRINDLRDNVTEGEPYQLPATVNAIMSNRTSQAQTIVWNTTTPNTNLSGLTTITGTVTGYAQTVKLTLAVGKKFGVPAAIATGQPIVIQGGIVVDLGGMSIPAGATVTVTEVTQPNLGTSGVQTAGKIVEFNFSNVVIGQPVKLSLPLNAGADPTKAAVYLYKGSGEWEYQPSQYAEGQIVATIPHFSTYGVLIDQNAPVNVTLTRGSMQTGQVELSLSATDISGEIKFQIYRNNELITTTSATTYIDQGLTNGTPYSYQIKAIDRFGNISEFSSALDITLQAGNADLTGISSTAFSISPAFNKDILTYIASVNNGVTQANLSFSLSDSAASIKVGETILSSSNLSQVIDLSIGENPVNIVVTAADGVTAKTYQLTVTRASAPIVLDTNVNVSSQGNPVEYNIDNTACQITSGNTNIDLGMTVSTFLTNLNKGHVNQTLAVYSNGTVFNGNQLAKTADATMADSDILLVTAEDGSHTRQYTIIVTTIPLQPDNIAIVNYCDAQDEVNIINLTAGDNVKMYDAASGGNVLESATVGSGSTVLDFFYNFTENLQQIWFSLTGNGKRESARTGISVPEAVYSVQEVVYGDYLCKFSDDSGGPTFNYINLANMAETERTYYGHTDDAFKAVQPGVGFNFNFYGENYDTVYIGTNGYLTFGKGDTAYTNYKFPSKGTPRIAAYFDDLIVKHSGAGIYYVTQGEAPNRRFIVQWHDEDHYRTSPDTVDFEVILYETTNNILFQYQDTTFGQNFSDCGKSATIGLNKGDGNTASQYLFNGTIRIDNGKAIQYVPIAPH